MKRIVMYVELTDRFFLRLIISLVAIYVSNDIEISRARPGIHHSLNHSFSYILRFFDINFRFLVIIERFFNY